MAQYSAAEPSTKSPEATLNGPNIANESLRVFAGELSSFNQNHNSQHTLKSSATSPVTKEGLNKLEFNQNEDEDRLSTVELFQGCIPLLFKEIQNIFNSLEEMLLWLQEIKTFIPDHVLEDIQSSDPKMCCSPPLLTSRQHASMRSSVTKNSVSSCQSAGRESSTSKRPKFLRALSKTSGVGSSFDFVESASEKAELFTEALSTITPLIKIYKASLQILTNFEFQIYVTGNLNDDEYKVPIKGIECALKIVKSLELMNAIKYMTRIGVSVSEAQVGNIGNGTKGARYFATVGSCVRDATTMATLARLFNLSIVTDSSCFDGTLSNEKFIARPIDRFRKHKSSEIETLWTVIDEKILEHSEWLLHC
nr:unnamed protein product [Naegleria fowleri]